jgi:hypothetical protein
MTLQQALEANKGTLKGPTCSLCVLLTTLTADDAKALQLALNDPGFTARGISRALKAEGHNIADGTVNRHRKSDCRR